MNLLRSLIVAAFVSSAFFMPTPARATCGALPYLFTNNTSIVDASTTNANNSFLLTCATSVDFSQIGSAGIYASQIVPTTVAQATFGGTVAYTLPSAGIASGNSVLSASGITSAGNVLSRNGVFSAPATFPIQLCPNAACSFTVSTTGAVSATSFTAATGAGNGVLIGTSPTVFLMDQPGSGISVAGVSCSLVRFSQLNTSSVGCLDTFGNFGVLSGFNVRGHTVPFDAQAPGGTTTAHTEHGLCTLVATGGGANDGGRCVFTFVIAYSVAPDCSWSSPDSILSPVSNSAGSPTVGTAGSSLAVTATTTNVTFAGYQGNGSFAPINNVGSRVHFVCVGS